MPLSTLSVSGVTPCGFPFTDTLTPSGLDSTTSVPVSENIQSGAGMNCAPVNTPVINAIIAATSTNFLIAGLIGPRGPDTLAPCGTYMCGSTSCVWRTSRFDAEAGAGDFVTGAGLAVMVAAIAFGGAVTVGAGVAAFDEREWCRSRSRGDGRKPDSFIASVSACDASPACTNKRRGSM